MEPNPGSYGFIEPEGDSDSAFGDTNSTAYTESLRSSLFESIKENGRSYHRYRDGHYFIPEDEEEQERLDMQHEIFLMTMNRQLYHSPLSKDGVQNVLDIGTGTGIWAIDFADQHPSAMVIGTDLSPIQPPFVPPNCKFEIDDYEEPWTFPQTFDFVHGRMLAGSIADATALFKQVHKSLAPGGWFELQDFAFPVRSDDGTMEGTSFEELNTNLCKALNILGKDGGLAEKFKELMLNAGFQNVVEIRYKWPQNQWPKDKFYKQLGLWNMINTLDGLHGFSARLCTQVLGMSVEQLEVLLAACRRDIRDTSIHAYWPIHVVYGQKAS